MLMDINLQWDTMIWGSSLQTYLVTLLIVIVCMALLRITGHIVLEKLKKASQKTNTDVDDFIMHLLDKNLLPFLYLLTIYFGFKSLQISIRFAKTIHDLLIVAITFFVIRVLIHSLIFSLRRYLRMKGFSEQRLQQMGGIILLLNLIMWTVGFIFILGNLGYNVTTLITGLGVGGVAVALASQTILNDLFCYFIIFFDRPFEIGDFLIIGDFLGTVEYIGLKSTRIRSLWGEELIFANHDLVNARIKNYKSMQRRRVVFQIQVNYETPVEKISHIPELLRQIVQQQERVQFDRAHFASYSPYGLVFEIVYYVLSPDYNTYMDIQQAINLRIFEQLQLQGIRFAFPRQVIQMLDSPAITSMPG
jgi:small-conductance mechanosensitive channel